MNNTVATTAKTINFKTFQVYSSFKQALGALNISIKFQNFSSL